MRTAVNFFCEVQVVDQFETAQRTVVCGISDLDSHEKRIRPKHHPDGYRNNFLCRSCGTNYGKSRHLKQARHNKTRTNHRNDIKKTN